MGVRRAAADDVAGVARVHVDSWEGAYRGLMPDDVFDVVDLDFRLTRWSRYFDRSPVRTALFVAEAAGEVVGMASLGPSRDEDMPEESVGELFALYVTPDHWNAGHGRDLMVRCLDEMRVLGYERASLWVLDTNERGRSFYEEGGWRSDGSVKLDESFGTPFKEVRYRLKL